MHNRASKNRFVLTRSIASLAAAFAATVATPSVHAATLYWDGTGTTANGWNALTSWSTAVGATTPDPAAIPGSADIANFSISTITATAQTVNLNANQAALGLIFLGTNTSTTTLQGGGANRVLSLGTSGITVNSGAGAVTVGSTTANQNVALSLQGAQTWANGGANVLTIANGVSLGVAGANTLTLGGASANTVANTVSGVISDGSGTLSLAKTGASLWVLSGANTFTGGASVSAGLLQANSATAFGTGTLTVPASSTGRFLINGGVTIANSISIASGVTGTASVGLISQTGTGQATVNGTISIAGTTPNGGHFSASNTAGNELVLNGVITSSVGITQRDGRIIFSGGGTGYTALSQTGTTFIGVNNGISTTAGLTVAVSGSGTFDLRTFNQALTGLSFSSGGTATVTGTTGILTLNGNASSSGNFTHVLSVSTDLGGGTRSFTVADGTNAIDLQASSSLSNGTLNKLGAGTLALSGTSTAALTVNAGTVLLSGTANAPVTVNAGSVVFSGAVNAPFTLNAGVLTGTGTISNTLTVNAGGQLVPASATTTGTLNVNALAFGTGASSVRMKVGAGGDLISTSGLTAAGTTTLNLLQMGGALANGSYNVISYSGAAPGLSGFSLAPVGHATATLVDTGTAIALNVTGNDRVIWDGTATTNWATGTTGNWKLQSNSAATDFIESDDVIFPSSPTNSTVAIAANVFPSNVTFTNTAASGTAYTLNGAAGIAGLTGLTKSGDGALTLTNPNIYVGPTAINAGTLTGVYSATVTPIASASATSIAAGATYTATGANLDFTVGNSMSGAGTVIIDPNNGGTAGARTVTIGGSLAGFTGTLRLSPTAAGGTMRATVDAVSDLGGSTVIVDDRAQVFVSAANLTFPNNLTITGIGFSETAGNLGALRSNTDTWTGVITLNGAAKIGALAATATFTNAITGGALTFGGNINNAGAETLLLTGDGSGLTSLTVNDATGTSSAANITFSVGNNGTTGTIGAVPVTLKGDGFKTGIIRFDRADGYSLGASVTSSSPTAANNVRTQLQVDTLGTGFNTNGQIINLGLADATTPGGAFRVGNVRAGAIANVNSSITAGSVLVSAGAASGTLNLNSGATVAANSVTLGAGGTGSIMNIASGSTLAITSNLHLGEAANNSSVVNQAGGDVTFGTQLRIGHFATETSSYNISGGTLTATGAAPGTFPFTTAATEQSGGIYIGIDGAGLLTQNGGTVSTNFVVLDNRTEGLGAANIATGNDTYALNGGTLVLKNAFGVISRFNSTLLNFNGGTLQAAAGVSPNLDIVKASVGATSTVDTNGANTFSLYGPLSGTGTLNLIGGGTFVTVDSTGATTTAVGGTGAGNGGSLGTAGFNIASGNTLRANRTGFDVWRGTLAGTGTLLKDNTGTLQIVGTAAGFTGAVAVNAGRLDLPAGFAASSLTVADGASIGGEPSNAPAVTLGTTSGSNLFIDASTAGAFKAASLTLNGITTVDFSKAPASTASPITVLNYTTVAGALNFALANASSYRAATFDTSSPGTVLLSLTTKDITWSGTGGAAWDVNSTTNWNDSVPNPEKFFSGDTVNFGDGPTQLAVTVTSGVAPFKTSVNSSTNNYTFTSTTNGIAGSGNLEKSGASTLTLSGPNTYSGQTLINGGTVAISSATSLGNGSITNSIGLSNGGRLNYTAATAVDLGSTRSIAVGTGGGVLAHSNATGATISIPGAISGNGSLSFSSTLAGAGTFVLNGDNSGYTGAISVDAQSTGLTAIRFGNQGAVPVSGSVTLNYPAAGATGNATTLDLLGGISLPAGLTVNMTTFLNGTISLRSQINTAGEVTINSPITVSGSAIAQVQPSAGSIVTMNGPVTAGIGGFTGTLFIRGTGTGIINSVINIPNGTLSKTDASTWTINSTGNTWAATNVVNSGSVRLGANNALATGAVLVIGQNSDANNSLLEMNGFNQEVNGLSWIAGSGNSTRGVGNSNAATQSVLTLNSATDYTYGASTGVTGGIITGNIALVKNGTNTQTLAGANTFTGNVTVNSGTLVAGGTATTSLGSATTVGRLVTVNSPGALSFTTNNIFGNGVGNANLPSIILNGATLISTRYNVLGALTLNGATLSQAVTDSGSFEGYQFRGSVTVGGTAASSISTTNGKANHLAANTVFTVADATSSPSSDLIVSAPLRDSSGDFGGSAGGLTKQGPGTMEVSGINSFTGPSVINEGTLFLSGSFSGSPTIVNSGGTFAGTGTSAGTVSVANGGILAPGGILGTLTTGSVAFASGSIFSLEIGATTSDQLNSTGTGTLTGDVSLSLTLVADPTDGTSFTLLNSTGLSGYSTGARLVYGANRLDEGELFTVMSGSFTQDFMISYVGAGGTQIQLSAVPEPSAVTSVIAAVGLLGGLRRFRRRR